MAAVDKQLARAKESISTGSAYEAQQLLKSATTRFLRQNKVPDALQLLQEGVALQLLSSQVTCASELAMLFVDALRSSDTKYSPEVIERLLSIKESFVKQICALADAYPPSSSDAKQKDLLSSASDGCAAFLRAALRWSARAPDGPSRGDPRLHDALAIFNWQHGHTKDLPGAMRHFAFGHDSISFAAVLSQAMKEVHSDEVDLVLANAVLQCAAVSNLRTANHLMTLLAPPSPVASLPISSSLSPPQQLPPPSPTGLALPSADARPQVPDSPLMHFLHFLLLTLLRDAAPLFLHLRSLYQLSLRRDTQLLKYVDEVGQSFYRIQPQAGPSGLLAGLLQMLNASDE